MSCNFTLLSGLLPKPDDPHGNAKSIYAEKYVAPSLQDLAKLNDIIMKHTSFEDCLEEVLQEGIYLRNQKQLYNAWQKAKRRNMELPREPKLVEELFSNKRYNAFLLHCGAEPGNATYYIYYSRWVTELMFHCANVNRYNPSVIGLDRCYNLTTHFVTSVVFQPDFLIRRRTEMPPVLIAAVYIHRECTTASYAQFLSKLKYAIWPQGSLQGDRDISEFQALDSVSDVDKFCGSIFGSDEERAIVSAVKQEFPGSNQALCVMHIVNNLKRMLVKLSIPDDLKKKIVPFFNGYEADNRTPFRDCLLMSSSQDEYEIRYDKIMKVVEECNMPAKTQEKLVRYVNVVCDKLRENNWRLVADGHIEINWKNNHVEAINSSLRKVTKFQTQPIMDMCQKISLILQRQEERLLRAMADSG